MYTANDLLERRSEIRAASEDITNKLKDIERRKHDGTGMDIDFADDEITLIEKKEALDDLEKSLEVLEKGTRLKQLANLICCGWFLDTFIVKDEEKIKVRKHRGVNKFYARKLGIDSGILSKFDYLTKCIFEAQGSNISYAKFIEKFSTNLVNQSMSNGCKTFIEEVQLSRFFCYEPQIQVPDNCRALQDYLSQPETVTTVHTSAGTEKCLSANSKMILRQVLDEMKVVHDYGIVHVNLEQTYYVENNQKVTILPNYKDGNSKEDFVQLKSLLEKTIDEDRRPGDLESFLKSLDNPSSLRLSYYHPFTWTLADTAFLLEWFAAHYERDPGLYEDVCEGIPDEASSEPFTKIIQGGPYLKLYNDPRCKDYHLINRKVRPLLFSRVAFSHLYEHIKTNLKRVEELMFALCSKYMSAFMEAAAAHPGGQVILTMVIQYFVSGRS